MRKRYALVILILLSSCTKSQLSSKRVDPFHLTGDIIAYADAHYTPTDSQVVAAVNAAATGPSVEENFSSFTKINPQVVPGKASMRKSVYTRNLPASADPLSLLAKRKAEKIEPESAVADSSALWKKRKDTPQPSTTNGLAIASFVLGLVGIPFLAINGIFTLLFGALAITFGAIARSQLKKNGNAQKGKGLALAGFIVGIVETGIVVLAILIVLAFVASMYN